MFEHACGKCEKTFQSRSNLNQHNNQLHQEVKCDKCGKMFKKGNFASLQRGTDRLYCRVLPTSTVTTSSFNPVVTIITIFRSNVSSIGLPEKMQSRNGCIYLTFLHRVLLNVSSNCQPERRHSYICCICLAFLHYVPSNVPSNQLIGSTGSRSRPRFSQLPFWPAGFLTSLVAIKNITDIFLAIWTLQEQCGFCSSRRCSARTACAPG